jgi:ribose 5-phosphate isomerase A
MSTLDPSEQQKLKQEAAAAAAAQLENGMIVGLGSGTTSRLLVEAIGRRVAEEGLKIVGIPTSESTAECATALGIPLATLGEHPQVDVTIDGADEVELGTLSLIKGGGGNLLREKVVAIAGPRMVVIVDESKLVKRLGTHWKVPVEVAQFGWQSTAGRLTALKSTPYLRKAADGSPFVTDGGNYILDCEFGPIASASDLAKQLDGTVGVMEHGLFIGMATEILIGSHEGVKKLTK